MYARKLFWLAFGVVFVGTILLSHSARLFAEQAPPEISPAIERAAPPEQKGIQGPFVGEPIRAREFNGDVRRLPAPSTSTERTELPRPRQATSPRAATSTPPTASDPVRQSIAGGGRAPIALQNFDGLNYTGWFPPDPNGDVGPNHYVQAVNTSAAIFDKTGTLLASFHYNTLFASAIAPCNSPLRRGDPIALYDTIADRWILTDFAYANSTGPYYQCIAVSKTANPVTGGWWLYTLDAGSTSTPGVYWFNDYPKLGSWSDGIYMSADMFEARLTYRGVRVWAFNRDDLINNPMTGVRYVYFDISPTYIHLLPSNLRGTTMPPGGTPNFFVSLAMPDASYQANTLHLWKFHVDWNNLLNSTLTGPTNLTTAVFTMPCYGAAFFNCVPQLNGESVDGLGDRLMMQLQYRNLGGTESLWVNHTVAAGAAIGFPTGVRWYEIRNPNGAPSIYQQGTYQPDSNYRWMGSLAVDGQGNMALGYSVSSSSMYPSIRYAGRFANEPLGKLCVPETSLIEGTGAQINGFNRWGDYSAMTVDPTDDLTFWYTNQYYSLTGDGWKTRIGSFRFGDPSPGATGPYVYYFPWVSRSSSPPCY